MSSDVQNAEKLHEAAGTAEPVPASPTAKETGASQNDNRFESHPPSEENLKPSANHAASVPNGGLQAWLQVLGGWFLFFNSWGIINTWGVFQTYYESGVLFQQTSSNIAWVGAIQAFCILVVGAFTGPIYDAGHLRSLLLLGSFLLVFGFMMTSLCTEFWQVILAQGFTIGLGGGCLFIPSVAILPTYFNTKLGLAVGLAASGSSMGGIIYPIAFYKMLGEIGFGWSVRVLGFMVLGTQLIPLVVMKMRVKPPSKRKLFDPTFFTDVPTLIFVASCFVGFISLYIALVYISYYSAAERITSESLSFYLVPILNAGSVFGRTVPNWLSDRFGPLNLIVPGSVVVGILLLCMLAVHSVGSIVVVTLLLGFFTGVFIALPPVIIVALTQDKRKVGTRIGMSFACFAFAVLCGAPGGGGVIGTDDSNLNWTGLWIYGGVCGLAGAAGLTYLRIMRGGMKLKVKV